jgi:hypothetical protein
MVYDKRLKQYKNINLKDGLPYDQDVSELAVAYIDNLVVDHRPTNLQQVIS